MTKPLHISPALSLPLDFVTSTQIILAQKGKGKTHTAVVEAEELLDAGQQIVVLDPTDAWWGLRSSPDGKSTGYPIAVFGGDHGDVALEPTGGSLLAEAIVAEGFSAIVSTENLSKAKELTFVADFLETLYRHNRKAMHLFIDEADIFAPQKPFGGEARTCGAADDIVRRGRKKGIGCTLITQRSSVLNKNVLSQADMLMALGCSHPRDLDAIGEWVKVHADPKVAAQMMESLPALPRGDAWAWNPAADIFKRITIRERHTFDSGRTPKPGEAKRVANVLAPVDIKRLGERIAATVEQAKANDPKALKARVAELEKQLVAKMKIAPKVETKVIEKPLVTDKVAKSLADSVTRIETRIVPLVAELAAVKALLRTEPWKASAAPTTRQVAVAHFANDGKVGKIVGKHQIRVVDRSHTESNGVLPSGEAKVLRALIQYVAGLDRRQIGVLTTFKKSTRDAYILRLRERGYVDVQGDRVLVTREGAAAMPDAEPLPTGTALQDYWLQRLPSGEGTILAKLLEVNGEDFGRDDLTEATGFKRSTRDAYLSRLAAKELVVDAGRGFVKASPTLFEVAS